MGKGISLRTFAERVDGQLSEEVRVNSRAPQGNILGPLMFLAYINDIWRNNESNKGLFADNCIIYRKIMNNSNIDVLQRGVKSLGEFGGIK
jgi:hypothetical protein